MRQAMPGFAGFFTREQLFALAGRDDVESRLVVRIGDRWTLAHGPFRRADFRRCRGAAGRCWCRASTCISDDADALLRRFAFVPYARLDDLMVSYAAPGGGVGPHFDSYDVFLLQGTAPPLALRPPGRSRRCAPDCRSRSCALRAAARGRARARRHAVPAARLRARRRRGRRLHDVFDRLSRGIAHRDGAGVPGSPARRSRYSPDAMPIPTSALRRAGAHRRADAAAGRRGARAASGGTAPTTRAIPGRASVRAEGRRLLRRACRAAVACGVRQGHRASRRAHSTAGRNGCTMTPRCM